MVDENHLFAKSKGGKNHYSSQNDAPQISLQLSFSTTPQILPVKYNFLPLMIWKWIIHILQFIFPSFIYAQTRTTWL